MSYKIFFILAFLPFCVLGQKQGNIWYFGNNAGLDFNSGTPAPLLDGQLYTYEGCATIADAEGNLLFYTDGISVWNKDHQFMPNGRGLLGNSSSTQSGVIIPFPNNPDLYYIFTVDEKAGPKGLHYSLVDMTLDGGLGDITSKNISLLPNSTEKITAVHHKNKKDIWVIAHAWNSDAFYVWLVNETGISTMPNIFNVGSTHSGSSSNSIGYLKASPDGSKIALAVYASAKFIEVFDFDNTTGRIVHSMKFDGFGATGPYGVEFSPNSQLLYISEGDGETKLYQYNLSLNEITAIKNSRVEISVDQNFGALQLASDEKIYLARDKVAYLGVINAPNEVGDACNFNLDGIYLGGRRSRMGLPTFIQSYFLLPNFSYVDTCFLATTQFFSEIDDPEATITWDFGDPDSGEQNVSSALNPTHTFSSPGIYKVTLTATVGEVAASKSKEINIVALPDIQLGVDAALCEGEALTLDISHLSGTYHWQDGSTASSVTITEPGIYWVEADNGICTARDSIVVSYDMLPSLALGNDTTLCTGDTLLLQAPANMDNYQWQNGSTAPSLTVEQAGTYSVEVTSGACKVSDAIDVTYRPNPSLDLGPDRRICKDETLLLDASDEYADSYLWEDGSTNPERNVNAAGVYRVTIDNLCHTQSFTDSVTIKSMAPKVTDTLLCGAGSATLQVQGEAAMYQWYATATGPDTDILHESADGTFITPPLDTTTPFWVSAVDGQCESERVKAIVFVDLTSAQAGNDTTIHLGESLPLQASGGNTYQWSPSQWLSHDEVANPIATPLEDITYTVTVTSHTGCVFEDDVTINVLDELLIPNTFTPNGDGINDTWIITYIENYENNQVLIFDRTGRQLMAFDNYQQSWDGTIHGNPLPGDTYFYIIRRGDYPPLKGSITIIR